MIEIPVWLGLTVLGLVLAAVVLAAYAVRNMSNIVDRQRERIQTLRDENRRLMARANVTDTTAIRTIRRRKH